MIGFRWSTTAIFPSAGFVEHDAEELFQNTLSVLGEAALKYRGQLAALAITNQRETFVVFERGTGRPLHNAVVWQCRRGDTVCNELRAAGKDAVVAAKTGLKIDSYFSGPKITALLRRRPEAERASWERGGRLIGTIDAYLLYRLTKAEKSVPATDATNASRTLFLNIRTLAWDAELSELFGVPLRALAEVRDSTARYGIWCDSPGDFRRLMGHLPPPRRLRG